MGALPRPTLPGGPARSLFDALHELHHRAGWPSLRDMSRDVGSSHTTIAAAFAGPRVPRWGLLELIVETLGGDTDDFHRLWLAATGSAPAQERQTSSVPRQLPADVVGFTGRSEQLEQLDAILAQDPDGARLGVLSGTPGVGKTALAVHWAHRVAAQFPDGQLYVNLRGYDPDSPLPPDEALEALLRALGVDGASVPMAAAERAARWRSAIAGRRMFLLLDNANSVEQVRELLPGEASAFVLVTSRDALPGLVARHGARRVGLDLLDEHDAVALLRRLVGPRVDDHPEAARALAERTARLPLALRIVAELALVREDDRLDELVAEFDDDTERLDLLSAGDDRYTAVRAVFSWSQRQLGDAERRAFALLGLHPGTDIDEHAMSALLGLDLRATRRVAAVLTRAHLVDERRGRYGMHDLLRAYSAELAVTLDDTDRRHAVNRLHDHYLTSASSVDRTAVGYAWLDAERANLLAVAAAARLVWPAHTVGIAVAIARYLDTCAYYSDALALDEMALAAAREGEDESGEATALNLLGSVHHRLGHFAPARDYHEQALAIHRSLDDRLGAAAALHGLGTLSVRTGHYAEAAESLEDALRTYVELDDAQGEGNVLYILGIALLKLGRYDDAAARLTRGVEVSRQSGDRTSEGRSLNNLGEVHLRLGRLDEAASSYEASLAIARELHNRVGEGIALLNLATVDLRRSRTVDARARFEQSITVCRDVGYEIGEAEAVCGLGMVNRADGRPDDAIACLTESIRISASLGETVTRTASLVELGWAHRDAGADAAAERAWLSALALAEQSEDGYEQARAHLGLASVLDGADALAHRKLALDGFAVLRLPPDPP